MTDRKEIDNLSDSPAGRWIRLMYEATKASCLLRRILAEIAADYAIAEAAAVLLMHMSVRDEDGISQRDMASSLSISPAKISTTFEQLRRDGLAVAKRDPHDRRRQLWKLTHQGRQTASLLSSKLDSFSLRLSAMAPSVDPIELALRLAEVSAAADILNGNSDARDGRFDSTASSHRGAAA